MIVVREPQCQLLGWKELPLSNHLHKTLENLIGHKDVSGTYENLQTVALIGSTAKSHTGTSLGASCSVQHRYWCMHNTEPPVSSCRPAIAVALDACLPAAIIVGPILPRVTTMSMGHALTPVAFILITIGKLPDLAAAPGRRHAGCGAAAAGGRHA